MTMATQEEDAQRLRSLLEASPGSPGDIVAVCRAVESVSRHLPRPFFRHCFPLLLRRVFGFEDFQAPASGHVTASGGWLSQVSQPGNEAAASVLIALLAPGGTLFRSILAPDNENVVRYVFPSERLPEWVRRVLAVEQGAAVLGLVSTLFKNKLKEDLSGNIQVELDVFQYYIFWFAYYAVCKESTAPTISIKKATPGISRSSQLRTQIESWASSIPGLHHSLQQGTLVSPLHPYLQLLQMYLSHFVDPTMLRRAKQASALWQEDSVTHADILVRTLIEFWLIDDDPVPFSLAICQSIQLHMFAPAPVYIPPGRDVIDAVRMLINYFSALLQTQLGNHEQLFTSPESAVAFRRKAALLADIKSSSPSALSSTSVSPYLQFLQRPLYRFCLRAFCFWPIGTPVAKALPVVDLWLHYLEPWTAILLVPKESNVQPGSRVLVDERNRFYSGYWHGYVLFNYVFYTAMVSHFLDFALKFLHVDMELIFQATCKVLSVLSKSNDLLDLLRRVDAAYNDHFMGRLQYVVNPFADRIQAIQEQLQDWEEGIASSAEQEHGEILRTNPYFKVPRIRLFAPTEYGGHHVLQSMILQAEAELRASCSERVPMSPKTLETTKALVKKVFNQDVPESPAVLEPESGTPLQAFPDTIAPEMALRNRGLQKHAFAEVKYKGDWMRRPIESQEIAWLVRLLVRISDKLNNYLGFSPETEQIRNQCGDESGDATNYIKSVCPEALRPVFEILLAVLRFLRRQLANRGFRINLRPLAHKQVLCSILLALLVYWLALKVARFAVFLVECFH